MELSWQDAIALLSVTAAVTFLAYRALLSWRKQSSTCGCRSCPARVPEDAEPFVAVEAFVEDSNRPPQTTD
jgi:hypothetical protein